MNLKKLVGISLTCFTIGSGVAFAVPASAPLLVEVVVAPVAVEALSVAARSDREPASPPIVFRHGDISWLPQLASEAGWPRHTWERLGQIILRESGGCPNRRGGDKVDKNCVITGVSEWTHRSDSGALQLNGVHWKPSHPQYHGLICKRMGICTQEPLLDALTNLAAGKLLFDEAGWSPWDPQPKKAKKLKTP